MKEQFTSAAPWEAQTFPHTAERLSAIDATADANPVVYSWTSRQVGPPFVRLSARCVRFDEHELDRWLEARVQVPSGASNVLKSVRIRTGQASHGGAGC